MVGAADVDVGQSVGAVEQLVWGAAVRYGFPDEQWLLGAGVEGLAAAEDRGDEADAALGVADHVEALGEEEGGGEGIFVEA